MNMEPLLQRELAVETGVLRENWSYSCFDHLKSHITRVGIELGPPQWEPGE
jgi:hypothetical protein